MLPSRLLIGDPPHMRSRAGWGTVTDQLWAGPNRTMALERSRIGIAHCCPSEPRCAWKVKVREQEESCDGLTHVTPKLSCDPEGFPASYTIPV